MDSDLAKKLIDSVIIGEAAYAEFRELRLDKKTVKLLETIKRTTITTTTIENRKLPDINKETQPFMKTIDIARVRNYNLATHLQHELSSNSFYLTSKGGLRKSEKAELLRELKPLLTDIPETFPLDSSRTALIIDFMAYCRKVPVKKLNLQTYEDFFTASLVNI